jgi:hypothetical protein
MEVLWPSCINADSCRRLILVWAVLDLYITHATCGTKSPTSNQQLKRMRYKSHGQPIPRW